MNTILFALFAIFALAYSADFTSGPSSYSIPQGINTAVILQIGNTLGGTTSMTQVSFTVGTSDSNVLVSYPAGGTKSTVGTITSGSAGSGSFYLIGANGQYTLYFTISYKKGTSTVTYTGTATAGLAIGESSGGAKREIEIEIDLADLHPETQTDESRINEHSVRGTDLTLSPNAYAVPASIPTWVNLYITAKTYVREVTYAVSPSDSNVIIYYPGSNSVGTINGTAAKPVSKTANFQINGPEGAYELDIYVMYKKGTTSNVQYVEQLTNAGLAIGSGSGGARSVNPNSIFQVEVAPVA